VTVKNVHQFLLYHGKCRQPIADEFVAVSREVAAERLDIASLGNIYHEEASQKFQDSSGMFEVVRALRDAAWLAAADLSKEASTHLYT
jgi:hypothetical protein